MTRDDIWQKICTDLVDRYVDPSMQIQAKHQLSCARSDVGTIQKRMWESSTDLAMVIRTLKEIAQPGSGFLFSYRYAAGSAAELLAERIGENK